MGPGHLGEGIFLLLGTIDTILMSTGSHSYYLCLGSLQTWLCSPEVTDTMGKSADKWHMVPNTGKEPWALGEQLCKFYRFVGKLTQQWGEIDAPKDVGMWPNCLWRHEPSQPSQFREESSMNNIWNRIKTCNQFSFLCLPACNEPFTPAPGYKCIICVIPLQQELQNCSDFYIFLD